MCHHKSWLKNQLQGSSRGVSNHQLLVSQKLSSVRSCLAKMRLTSCLSGALAKKKKGVKIVCGAPNVYVLQDQDMVALPGARIAVNYTKSKENPWFSLE